MPSRSFIGDYTAAPKYKINACHIGKSFSSVTLSIFCYLNNKKVFLKKYGTSKDKINFRDMCGRENNHHNLPDIYKKYAHNNKTEFFENWKNIMIVREPIKRFISGFVQICVLQIGLQPFHPYCFGCYNNVECFLQNLYFDIKAVQNNLKEPNYFIKYHFYPQTWQCDYIFLKDKYKILHYNDDMEAFYRNYLYEFKDNNVPENDLLFINEMFHTVKIHGYLNAINCNCNQLIEPTCKCFQFYNDYLGNNVKIWCKCQDSLIINYYYINYCQCNYQPPTAIQMLNKCFDTCENTCNNICEMISQNEEIFYCSPVCSEDCKNKCYLNHDSPKHHSFCPMKSQNFNLPLVSKEENCNDICFNNCVLKNLPIDNCKSTCQKTCNYTNLFTTPSGLANSIIPLNNQCEDDCKNECRDAFYYHFCTSSLINVTASRKKRQCNCDSQFQPQCICYQTPSNYYLPQQILCKCQDPPVKYQSPNNNCNCNSQSYSYNQILLDCQNSCKNSCRKSCLSNPKMNIQNTCQFDCSNICQKTCSKSNIVAGTYNSNLCEPLCRSKCYYPSSSCNNNCEIKCKCQNVCEKNCYSQGDSIEVCSSTCKKTCNHAMNHVSTNNIISTYLNNKCLSNCNSECQDSVNSPSCLRNCKGKCSVSDGITQQLTKQYLCIPNCIQSCGNYCNEQKLSSVTDCSAGCRSACQKQCSLENKDIVVPCENGEKKDSKECYCPVNYFPCDDHTQCCRH
uniref:Zinc finger protein n=1 Tax=Strongyloides venezuelensis TaxID=75913 RepID=A0A0K0F0R3_STRVS